MNVGTMSGAFMSFFVSGVILTSALLHLHIWFGGDVAEQSVTHRTVASSVFPQVDDEVAYFVFFAEL